MALCKVRTVCFSKLATCFDSPASASSCLRRIQRFYAKQTLDSDLVARLIFRLLPIMEPLQLAIDKTNWQFGRADINIFMLAVVHDGKPELQVIISYNQPQDSVGIYRRRWQIEKIKPIRILKHGRKEKSIIRYGLDIVADYLQRGRNVFKTPIFDLFSVANQIFT